MTPSVEYDFSQLSYEQKMAVMTQLEASMARDVPVTAEIASELERRLAMYDAGEGECYSWEEVKASLTQELRNQ